MDLTYGECLAAAAATPELVEQFDRLSGHHLSRLAQRTPINALIDEATGRDKQAVLDFAHFVFFAVYAPLASGGR